MSGSWVRRDGWCKCSRPHALPYARHVSVYYSAGTLVRLTLARSRFAQVPQLLSVSTLCPARPRGDTMRRFTHRLAPAAPGRTCCSLRALPAPAAVAESAATYRRRRAGAVRRRGPISMSGVMPVTRSLADSSAIGDLNVRSSARYRDRPPQTHIALTMSAGSPCCVRPACGLGVRLGPAGSRPARPVKRTSRSMGEAPRRRCHRVSRPATHPDGLAGNAFDTVPGALGESIVGAGGSTAAVGNSDGGRRRAEPRIARARPRSSPWTRSVACCMAMSQRALLAENADAPYGVSTDLDAFESRIAARSMDTGRPRWTGPDRARCR